jgi:hypothetical protein
MKKQVCQFQSISKYHHLPGRTKGMKKYQARKDNRIRLQWTQLKIHLQDTGAQTKTDHNTNYQKQWGYIS